MKLISGVADAATAAQFTEQIQAAQTTPTQAAMVQGQLDGLMQQFVGGNTPAWAAGAIVMLTQRWLHVVGCIISCWSGYCTRLQWNLHCLLHRLMHRYRHSLKDRTYLIDNRCYASAQQRASLWVRSLTKHSRHVQNSARIGDIANMNFTAEQQVQLENSRATNTMNLNNLSNSQAMVMAEASALAQMDTQN